MNNISDRITEYLASGGLFNPEAMEHEKVRDLLIGCRAYMVENPPAVGSAAIVHFNRDIASIDAFLAPDSEPHREKERG